MTRTPATYAELNAVLDQARTRWAGSVTTMPITDAALLGLQQRWTTTLAARLDQAIEFAGAEPLADSVAAAWRELATDQPTLRAVLDAKEADSRALTEAMHAEFRILAMAAGLIGLDDVSEESITIGRSLRELIRTGRTELATV